MQTHPDVEHLVLDGASRDQTVDIVRQHSGSSIRLISEPDLGIYDAMNKGVALATGEVIGFLNSDDYFPDSEVLSKIASSFADPEIDACYGDLVYVKPETRQVVRFWKSRPFRKGDFAKGWCPAHPTFYVRASVFKRFGGFDQSYQMGCDVELMMRFLEKKEVIASYIPHVLVHMRTGGVSNQSWANIVLQNKEIYKALENHHLKYSPLIFWSFKLARRFAQILSGYFRHGG